ncbi:gliding motility-associated C-terminal domain-containing protein, partial [Kordia sp.]|uniref:gliding motility-associated C-terminal domain-containing protein n=1 Tax=Kordia sp. TaxID=1965332 RepID=UPI003D6C5DC0
SCNAALTNTTTVTFIELPEVILSSDCDDVNYKLYASLSTPDAMITYEWYDPSDELIGTNDNVTITESGFYRLVISKNGCFSEESIYIENANCSIPKGVSPNNDSLNDTFDLSNLDVKRLQIFNRHGIEVYSRSNYTNEWNGQTNKGDKLPTGTYYYLIEFENGNSTSGWVYLNR